MARQANYCKVIVYLMFISVLSSSFSSASTSQPTTAEPATTPTMAATTVATDAPTTTPTFAPTVVPSYTDITNCTCDLTANACDINCCCDIECDHSDLLAFTYCYDEYTPSDSQYCVQNTVVFVNNVPYTVTTSQNGLFCIQVDNYEERNYYIAPAIIPEDQFEVEYQKYVRYTVIPEAFSYNYSQEYYKSGDVLFTIYSSSSLGVLRQPSASGTSYCLDTNTQGFLLSQDLKCVRRLTSLGEDCMTNTALQPGTYYRNFKLVPTPSLFNSFTPDNLPPDVLQTMYNSSLAILPTPLQLCLDPQGLRIDCPFTGNGTLPSPTYDLATGVCSNAVVKVAYLFQYNGTSGITKAEVQFTFQNLSNSKLPLTQEFSSAWSKPDEKDTFHRSGNPGYLIGQPLLAGNLTTNADKSAISLNTDRSRWFTIPTSTLQDGSCGSQRISINFGQNQRASCFISIYYLNLTQSCTALNTRAMNILRGDEPPSHVASFGNSSVNNVGDWNQIIQPNTGSNQPGAGKTGQCTNVITGLDTQIIYARAGDISNPQNRVIGVRQEYIIRSVTFQCYGAYCQPNNLNLSQPLELTASVTFVDSTQMAVPRTGEIPDVPVSLPADFFYPFNW